MEFSKNGILITLLGDAHQNAPQHYSTTKTKSHYQVLDILVCFIFYKCLTNHHLNQTKDNNLIIETVIIKKKLLMKIEQPLVFNMNNRLTNRDILI